MPVTKGLYSVTLGETTPIPTSIFNNSSSVSLQIKVEGTTLSPTTEILSVPYAYKAEKAVEAENVPTNNNELTNGAGYISDGNTNWNNTYGFITSPDDADADATNELNTSATLTGSDLKITDAGGTKTVDLSSLSDSLTLPYSSTYSGSSNAFEITNTGTGSVAKFKSNISTSTNPTVIIENNGMDNGLDIKNTNSSNEEAAIYAETMGEGAAISARSYGDYAHAIYAEANGLGLSSIEAIYKGTDGYAGYFQNENTSNPSPVLGVYNNGGSGNAVYASTSGTGNAGYFKISNLSNAEDAIYAYTNGTGYAGYFDGNVNITGTLTGGKASSKIDDPLDPENKYLYHSFVESPDMKNVYDGNVILDNNGEAIVKLPDYFEALNKEFRYQLTCIGGYAPVYVAKEISGNSFKIAGGKSGMKISWQVTGVRQDPYANAHRIQVEVEKSAKEKGHYLHYKEYNQPIKKSIRAVKHPEILKELNENKEE